MADQPANGSKKRWAETRAELDDALNATFSIINSVPSVAQEGWNETARLLKTVKYLAGIAERGTGRPMPDDVTVERFVLEYVQALENRAAQATAATPAPAAPLDQKALADFIRDYEWRTDEFCHAPTEQERAMLNDFAVLLQDEFAPAAPQAVQAQPDQSQRIAELERQVEIWKAEVDKAVAWLWRDGPPPFPQDQEWFIAETKHGKAVLRALPDEHTYDYTTADHTYIIRANIKRWAQFPDSEYIAPSTPEVAQASVEEVRDAALEEAATHITKGNEQVRDNGWIDAANERARCAQAIRALKRSTSQAPASGAAAKGDKQ
jgi:hypothetical protein